METIKQVLMCRDNHTEEEADDLIFAARESLQNYLDLGDIEGVENVCEEYFGLELDYLFDLL